MLLQNNQQRPNLRYFSFWWCSPTFYKIWKRKAVEEFSPIPYLATLLNCMMWVFYGLPFVTKDSTLVYTINGIGLAIEAIYLILYFTYAPSKDRVCKLNLVIPYCIRYHSKCTHLQIKKNLVLTCLLQWRVVRFLGAEIIFMVAVVLGVILGTQSLHTRNKIVGILCVIFGTCMYASPLSVMVIFLQCICFSLISLIFVVEDFFFPQIVQVF